VSLSFFELPLLMRRCFLCQGREDLFLKAKRNPLLIFLFFATFFRRSSPPFIQFRGRLGKVSFLSRQSASPLPDCFLSVGDPFFSIADALNQEFRARRTPSGTPERDSSLFSAMSFPRDGDTAPYELRLELLPSHSSILPCIGLSGVIDSLKERTSFGEATSDVIPGGARQALDFFSKLPFEVDHGICEKRRIEIEFPCVFPPSFRDPWREYLPLEASSPTIPERPLLLTPAMRESVLPPLAQRRASFPVPSRRIFVSPLLIPR